MEDDWKLVTSPSGPILDRSTANVIRQASDARVFVTVTRNHVTISQIARFLKISRQAAQSSVRWLQKLGVLDLEPMPGNKRDKLVVVTARGRHAAASAGQQIMQFEREFAAVIGQEALASVRKSLVALLAAAKSNNARDKAKFKPPA